MQMDTEETNSPPPRTHGRTHAWLELIRVPNLFTVPGDVLVGMALASRLNFSEGHLFARVVDAILFLPAAAVLLYIAGLILNDLHDQPQDAETRPERPLPSGRIPRPAAWVAAVTAMIVAVLLSGRGSEATVFCALILCALVVIYNFAVKHLAGAACVVMGFCRGFSMLMGGLAHTRHSDTPLRTVLGALFLTTYIGFVTWIARRENEVHRPGWVALAPPLIMLLGWLSVLAWIVAELRWEILGSLWSPLCAITLFVVAQQQCWRSARALWRREVGPDVVQPTVGAFIECLIPWQSSLLFLCGCPIMGLLVLLGWPLTRVLRRHFAAS